MAEITVGTTFRNRQNCDRKICGSQLSGPGKGLSDSHKLTGSEKLISPHEPAQCIKNCYSLLFNKYEIHKGQHLYRMQDKGRFTHLCIQGLNKIQNKQSINQLPCMNAEIKRGERGECKSGDPGTENGVRLGTGR